MENYKVIYQATRAESFISRVEQCVYDAEMIIEDHAAGFFVVAGVIITLALI